MTAARALGTHTDEEWLELIQAADYRCAYCGQRGRRLERDHKTPISRGGSDLIENIAPCCRSCNSKKGTATEEEYLAQRAEA